MSKELEQARELVRMLEERERQDKVQLSTLSPGEVFRIGKYDFIVLEQSGIQTKVISKDLLAKNKKFGADRDYKESNVKRTIESDIQPMIERELGTDSLIEHEIALVSVDMQNEFGACTCKVRPVTFDEAREFNDLLVNEELPNWYWTLTPWSTKERGWEYNVTVVGPSGFISRSSCYNGFGVRPFCILKSNIFVSKGE